MPRSICSIGSGTPMTPVELTSTRSGVVSSSRAAAAAMRRAFCNPTSPVATLLTLLFATMARSRPPLIVSRPRITGAPGNRLRVNTAAAAASTSLANSDRSFPSGLRPILRLAQRKPPGKRGRSWNSGAPPISRSRSRSARRARRLRRRRCQCASTGRPWCR